MGNNLNKIMQWDHHLNETEAAIRNVFQFHDGIADTAQNNHRR